MRLEVEQKFPVQDLEAVRAQLVALGADLRPAEQERDRYYAHPARDFAQTDEALRIRQKGNAFFLTYKGPKIDPTTKTRQEIDLALPSAPETFSAWDELLVALGFRPVAEVLKNRGKAFLPWQGHQIEVSLDEVAELGTFVELELVTDPAGLDSARAAVISLAAHLGLSQSQRRSYLELLLQKRGAKQPR